MLVEFNYFILTKSFPLLVFIISFFAVINIYTFQKDAQATVGLAGRKFVKYFFLSSSAHSLKERAGG